MVSTTVFDEGRHISGFEYDSSGLFDFIQFKQEMRCKLTPINPLSISKGQTVTIKLFPDSYT